MAHAVFVGNIDNGFKPEDLLQLFMPYGEIQLICFHPHEHYGFALIQCQTKQIVKSAVIALNQTVLKGRTLRLSFAKMGKSI